MLKPVKRTETREIVTCNNKIIYKQLKMYRVSSHVIKNASVLLRHCKPVELRVASFSRSPVSSAWYKKHRERDTCPPPKPPPLPPYYVSQYLIGTGVLLVLTAGFMVYAKNSDEIRDWLSINAPWFDDMIAVAYQENKKITEGIMDYLVYFKGIIEKYLEGPPEECIVKPPPPYPVSDKAAVTDGETCDDDDDDDEEDKNEEEEEDDEPECVMPPPPIVTKDICKLEECLKEAAEDTINNYTSLRDYCMYYNKMVQGTLSKYNPERLKALEKHLEEKNDFIEHYEAHAETALKRFNDLTQYISCGTDAPKDRINVTKQMAQDFQDLIKRNEIEYRIQNQRSTTLDKQWKIVKCTMDQYVSESCSMFPELDYEEDHPKVYGEELDLLMIHAKKYVDGLKEQMSGVTDYISGKITRAYDSLPCPKGKEKDCEAKLQNAVKQAKADMDKEYADRLTQLCKDFDEELKRKLRERQERSDEILAERLMIKEQSLNKKADKMVREKVEKEKQLLQAQLDAMKVQLTTVDQKLNARLKAERESKRAQLLHVASQSLLQATKKGEPRINVEKELEILRKASTDDTLVTTVLNAIPGEVRDKGLVPESVIRDNFHSMEDIAMKVAMVEAEGGPLPLYAFSWIQSKFLFMKPANVPQVELDNPPKEPFEDLDTFDLLQRARYFINNGNLANAVRYVNALEGASRGAAESWYQSANALLQTRLAAEAILAHAAAITLQYI